LFSPIVPPPTGKGSHTMDLPSIAQGSARVDGRQPWGHRREPQSTEHRISACVDYERNWQFSTRKKVRLRANVAWADMHHKSVLQGSLNLPSNILLGAISDNLLHDFSVLK